MKKIYLSLMLIVISIVSFAQGTWIQKTNFANGLYRAGAVGFSISGYAFIGLGQSGSNYITDFWGYDPVTNSWSQLANFPGVGRSYAVGFSIGTKGYVGGGYNSTVNPNCRQDFWEYDPIANTWLQKTNFSQARAYAFGFSIGNKGYIGAGEVYNGVSWNDLSDFSQWNQSTNNWTAMAAYPGSGAKGNASFSIGTKGYAGTGVLVSNGPYNDFWEWNQVTNIWSQKNDFAGNSRWGAVGFSIGTKGYIGTGCQGSNYYSDFWEYDPSANSWTAQAFFAGGNRNIAVGLSIGTSGYIGTGVATGITNDFWQWTQGNVGINENSKNETDISIIPNASQDIFIVMTNTVRENHQLEIYDVHAKKIFQQKIVSEKTEINLSNHSNGIYFVAVRDGENNLVVRKIVKM